MGCKIQQMDMKIVFINEMVEDEIYMEYPEGFEPFNGDTDVRRMKRAPYGYWQLPSRIGLH